MIKVNYSKTRSAAKKISYATENCKTMTEKTKNISSSISTFWKGASADAFSSELSEWIRENNAIQNELRGLSADITRIADEFEKTEERIATEASQVVCGGNGAYGSGSGGGGIR